ncbi:uncharacterized protein LAJ45_08442 [Morchella importuna]|uniref:uncharacterized protein n=1 Tax=Morchella importuna TaxID=1174673 RepID=UPI001E8D4333|nr:uncharacterized protein LAJ45_08442 [Morchella importuna]KAH8147614.1 hypothetical protein LAJ45_08442 [Morchella importuna]
MRITTLSLLLLPLAAETVAVPAPTDNSTWAEILTDIPFPNDPCKNGNLACFKYGKQWEQAMAKKKAALGSTRKLTTLEEITGNGAAVTKVGLERYKKKKDEEVKKAREGRR